MLLPARQVYQPDWLAVTLCSCSISGVAVTPSPDCKNEYHHCSIVYINTISIEPVHDMMIVLTSTHRNEENAVKQKYAFFEICRRGSHFSSKGFEAIRGCTTELWRMDSARVVNIAIQVSLLLVSAILLEYRRKYRQYFLHEVSHVVSPILFQPNFSILSIDTY